MPRVADTAARSIATNTAVDLAGLLEFLRPRHRMVLGTRRRDGSTQLSPVTADVLDLPEAVDRSSSTSG